MKTLRLVLYARVWIIGTVVLFCACMIAGHSSNVYAVMTRAMFAVFYLISMILGIRTIAHKKCVSILKGAFLMTYVAVSVVFGALCVSAISVNESPHVVSAQPSAQTIALTRSNLLQLVNEQRAKKGDNPLRLSTQLDESSQYKADDLVNRNYYSHTDPVTGKLNGIDKAFALTGDLCSYIAENIDDTGSMNENANFAVTAWVNSPDHYSAMIDPKAVWTGFGINGHIVVEQFCELTASSSPRTTHEATSYIPTSQADIDKLNAQIAQSEKAGVAEQVAEDAANAKMAQDQANAAAQAQAEQQQQAQRQRIQAQQDAINAQNLRNQEIEQCEQSLYSQLGGMGAGGGSEMSLVPQICSNQY